MAENEIEIKKKIWFRRKRYGWGWFPITWQGWLVIVIFVIGMAFGATEFQLDQYPDRTVWFIVYAAVLVVLLLLVCWLKGESPRWQWGEKREDGSKK